MTKKEFTNDYCKKSCIEWEQLQKTQIALPCACGELGCQGWAMVSNDLSCIQIHNELYLPIEKKAEKAAP